MSDDEHHQEKKLNGSGGNSHNQDDDNVVELPTLAERDRMRREQERAYQKEYKARQRAAHGPLINMPPLTKYMIGGIVLIQVIVTFLPGPEQFMLIRSFGFIPGMYTGAIPFELSAFYRPFTYNILHGGWLHVGMNAVMLAAFGSGVEKWLGTRSTIYFFIACGLIAAAAHFLLQPNSDVPVVGASGAISGMFAAAIMMLYQGGMLPAGRFGILPLVLLWIGISLVFGMFGAPGGESVAWAAHIGGFLGGFAVLKVMGRV